MLDGWGEPTLTLVPWRQGFRHPRRKECMGGFAQIYVGHTQQKPYICRVGEGGPSTVNLMPPSHPTLPNNQSFSLKSGKALSVIAEAPTCTYTELAPEIFK